MFLVSIILSYEATYNKSVPGIANNKIVIHISVVIIIFLG